MFCTDRTSDAVPQTGLASLRMSLFVLVTSWRASGKAESRWALRQREQHLSAHRCSCPQVKIPAHTLATRLASEEQLDLIRSVTLKFVASTSSAFV